MDGFALLAAASILAGAQEPATGPVPELDLDVAGVRSVPYRPRAGIAGPQAVEIRRFELHGIPVRGAFETVWRGVAGDRVVSARRPSHAPTLRPDGARVAREDLPGLLAHRLGRPLQPLEAPQLVYVDMLGHPVLAWEVELPLSHDGPDRVSQRTVWLSASSGSVVDERENVFSARARVYPENPVTTPEPVVVEIPDLISEGPDRPLVGTRVRAMGCSLTWPAPDEVPEDVAAWWVEEDGRCYPTPTVFTGPDGDFEVVPPDVRLREVHVDGDEGYAELSMYYHAEKFLAVMRSMGVDGFPCEQATMLANYRVLEPSQGAPELPYGPFNNAYYTGRCVSGPTMMFGQGSSIDFAFDGDVVYHELGHGIVALLTPDGLGRHQLTENATVSDARGANEAFADYLSLMITGDPELADYVGTYGSYSRPYIRTAENSRTCPDNIRGQEHADGEPLTAALWSARTRIGSALDDVVLLALTRLEPDASLTDIAAVLLEVATEVGEGALGEDGLEFLSRALESRGLASCPRVITDEAAVQQGRTVHIRKRVDSVVPFHPGPLQLRHLVPEGSDNAIVRFNSDEAVEVLLKRADAPIEFTYEFVVVEEPDDDGDLVLRELTAVHGDWDIRRAPTVLTASSRQVTVRGLLPGEVVYVALANTSDREAVAGSFHVYSVPSDELDEGSPPPGDDEEDGSETETDGGSESGDSDGGPGAAPEDGVVSSGCACGAGSTEGSLGGIPWLLLGVGRRRRCTG